MAVRYLRSRRQEGFISVIAWFSSAGIMLGVATLIIVMAVMNGFRDELMTRILGVNGHMNVTANSRNIRDFDSLAERIRAAGAGIGGFYTRTSVGTELADDKEHRTIDGQEYVLEYPLHADYAFIRAWKADTWGNLQFRLTQRNFNPIMAMAAKTTIVEVEEEILDAGAFDPDHVHASGIFVNRIVNDRQRG